MKLEIVRILWEVYDGEPLVTVKVIPNILSKLFFGSKSEEYKVYRYKGEWRIISSTADPSTDLRKLFPYSASLTALVKEAAYFKAGDFHFVDKAADMQACPGREKIVLDISIPDHENFKFHNESVVIYPNKPEWKAWVREHGDYNPFTHWKDDDGVIWSPEQMTPAHLLYIIRYVTVRNLKGQAPTMDAAKRFAKLCEELRQKKLGRTS